MPTAAQRLEQRTQQKRPVRPFEQNDKPVFVTLNIKREDILLSTEAASAEAVLSHVQAVTISNFGQVLGTLNLNTTRVLAVDQSSKQCLLVTPGDEAKKLSASLVFSPFLGWKTHEARLSKAHQQLQSSGSATPSLEELRHKVEDLDDIDLS